MIKVLFHLLTGFGYGQSPHDKNLYDAVKQVAQTGRSIDLIKTALDVPVYQPSTYTLNHALGLLLMHSIGDVPGAPIEAVKYLQEQGAQSAARSTNYSNGSLQPLLLAADLAATGKTQYLPYLIDGLSAWDGNRLLPRVMTTPGVPNNLIRMAKAKIKENNFWMSVADM